MCFSANICLSRWEVEQWVLSSLSLCSLEKESLECIWQGKLAKRKYKSTEISNDKKLKRIAGKEYADIYVNIFVSFFPPVLISWGKASPELAAEPRYVWLTDFELHLFLVNFGFRLLLQLHFYNINCGFRLFIATTLFYNINCGFRLFIATTFLLHKLWPQAFYCNHIFIT